MVLIDLNFEGISLVVDKGVGCADKDSQAGKYHKHEKTRQACGGDGEFALDSSFPSLVAFLLLGNVIPT